MVYSDFDLTEDEVSINGYGFIGKTEFQNGYAVFETSGSLEKVGYMTIFVQFDNSPFEAKPAVVIDLEAIRNSPNTQYEDGQAEEEKKELSKGAIIAIIIASVIGVIIIIVMVIILIKKRRMIKKKRVNQNKEKLKKEKKLKKQKNDKEEK